MLGNILRSIATGEIDPNEAAKFAFNLLEEDQRLHAIFMSEPRSLTDTEIMLVESAEKLRIAAMAALALSYKGSTGKTLDLMEASEPQDHSSG